MATNSAGVDGRGSGTFFGEGLRNANWVENCLTRRATLADPSLKPAVARGRYMNAIAHLPLRRQGTISAVGWVL